MKLIDFVRNAGNGLVKINDKFYDPSYGTGPYNTLLAWEDASLAGFGKRTSGGTPLTYWLIFRQNPAAADMKVAEEVPL
ncbi:MAG TPA: hypothetical protein VM597_35625 [Gemmataceae bacterium]|jgi:hypothetical protein|nr:hypothetical protein [Gemmataceae bacterium]